MITSSTCGSTFVWEELLALQIVGESQQLMLRALLTISRCGVAAKMSIEPLHQLDVGRAQAAEAEVEKTPRPVGEPLRHLPLGLGLPDRALERCHVGASGTGVVVGLLRRRRG